MYVFIKWILLLLLFPASLFCLAQQVQPIHVTDSVNLSLENAESIFLKNNFLLLAQKYNVDMEKALVTQARLYPNPAFNFATTIYNPITKKIFPLYNEGEVISGISQLIILAGKRNKQIKLAQATVKLYEYQFFDLIRTLKYTLRTDFYNIYYLQHSSKAYNAEIKALEQIVSAFEVQKGKGYIAEKEVIRIKALLYNLRTEYNDLQNQIYDRESELRQLIQVKPHTFINPILDTEVILHLDPQKYQLSTLLDTAYTHRTDLLIARQNTRISKLNLNYQKALAIPDVTANISYDQQGSYVHNLSMAGLAFELPFSNRNQGNIKSAKFGIDVATATQNSVEISVEENVTRAFQRALDQDRLFKAIDPKFSIDFDRLIKEILINYQKRNITILEFLDYYDSYKQSVLQMNMIKFNRVSAFEAINYYTANNFFN